MTVDYPKLQELISLLDKAVAITETSGCCSAIKEALEAIVDSGRDFIDEPFLRPDPNKYARRLLHKDPDGKYAAVVMVWDTGQGTALHDHAGRWCVECVYRGKIRVVSYSLTGQDGNKYYFKEEKTIHAGMGEAGALIPPFEYHVLENANDSPTVTIHVYAGELNWCNIFVPTEDGYVEERRELSYTSS